MAGIMTRNGASSLSEGSRYAQRIRRRYADELHLLARGGPSRQSIEDAYAALRTSGLDTGAALRVTRQLVLERLALEMNGRLADHVVSDMAPNLSGIESADAARIAHLVELAIEFALGHMKPEGALVVKVFHGSGYSQLAKLFKETFKVVKPIKPKASRSNSSETFLVGIGIKAPAQGIAPATNP